MTKPRRTKPTKAELAEAYRILELQEFRMLSLLACYEAFHGTLPDGVFEAVTREATEAQRLSPTNKQGMYERMVNGARHYRASMQIKEIQNAGDVSAPKESALISASSLDTATLAALAKQRP